jgi:hypothetical protein
MTGGLLHRSVNRPKTCDIWTNLFPLHPRLLQHENTPTSLIRADNSANPNRGGRSHLPGFMICGRSCEYSLIQYQSEDPRTAPYATERPRAICSCSSSKSTTTTDGVCVLE